MSRIQSDNELTQASKKAQDTGVRVQDPSMLPGSMAGDRYSEMASIPGDNALIDSAFGSNVSYLSSSPTLFEQLSESFDPWYDCGSTGLPNLKVGEAGLHCCIKSLLTVSNTRALLSTLRMILGLS